MKILKIVLIVFGILVVLVTAGIFIFLKTFDVNKYLPQMTAQVSQVLGRDFKVARAGLAVSWTQGVVLEAKDIVLADDPTFSDKPFLSIGRVEIGVNVGSLFFQQKIQMTQVVVDAPHVVIIRSKDGEINAATLAAAGGSVPSSENKAAAIPALFINGIKILGASVTYIDESFSPRLAVMVDHIDVLVQDFSLVSPFAVAVKAGLFSSEQNVTGDFKVVVDLLKQKVHITDVNVKADLARIDASVMGDQLPMVKPLALKELGGVFSLAAVDLQVSAKGVDGLQAQASLNKGFVLTGIMPVPLDNIAFLADMDAQQIDIKSISAMFADGVIRGNALVLKYLTSPVVGATLNVDQVDLKKVVEALKLPVGMNGLLFASGNVKFSGKTPDEIMASLRGDVKGELKDGVLLNVNLLALGLGKIPMLPGLLESVRTDLPSQTQEDVSKGITRFEACRVQGHIADGVFQLESGDMMTRDLGVHAQGSIELRGMLDVKADIRVEPMLSQRLIERVKDLSALKDEQGRIYVPVNINGPLARPKVMPDVGYLTQKLIAARGGEELQKVLGTPEASQAINAIFDLFKKK